MPLKDIVNDTRHRGRSQAAGIALPDTGHPRVSGELYKDPIPPSPARGRWGGDDHFKILQFHINVPLSICAALRQV